MPAASASLTDRLEPYLAELAGITPLSGEEKGVLFAAAAAGDPDARERIVLTHLQMVVKIACLYGGYGLPLGDLVSEGNIGLLRAAELYDPTLGVEFSTYAGVWIKQRIHRAITAQARVVRIPVWRSQRLRKLDRLHEELNAELGRDGEITDLASRIGMSEDDLARIAADRIRVDSFDRDAETAQRLASWSDPSVPAPGEHLSRQELFEEISACLHGLNDTELQVLSLKFGLLDDEPESYREMAPRFGKSREWIRKIGEGAMAKVRESLRTIGDLPRNLVKARKERADARLRSLSKKKAQIMAKLSLFQTVLIQEAEPLIPIFL